MINVSPKNVPGTLFHGTKCAYKVDFFVLLTGINIMLYLCLGGGL